MFSILRHLYSTLSCTLSLPSLIQFLTQFDPVSDSLDVCLASRAAPTPARGCACCTCCRCGLTRSLLPPLLLPLFLVCLLVLLPLVLVLVLVLVGAWAWAWELAWAWARMGAWRARCCRISPPWRLTLVGYRCTHECMNAWVHGCMGAWAMHLTNVCALIIHLNLTLISFIPYHAPLPRSLFHPSLTHLNLL